MLHCVEMLAEIEDILQIHLPIHWTIIFYVNIYELTLREKESEIQII